jgi:3-oxoacyl-[acyl-carrier-protein] synthase-1
MDTALSPGIGGVERFLGLARPAIEESLAPLLRLGAPPGPLHLYLGLPEPRPGLPPALDRELTRQLEDVPDLPPLRIATISHGHSAGLMALQQAWLQIQSGQLQFCLAGGVDTYLEAETLEWLDQERQLMSAENRSGFVPGEGAGFCLVTSTTTARRYGLDVLAWVVSVATTREENRIKTDTICIGKGLTAAILEASASLTLPEQRIDFTYCDLNGERYRSEEFTFALLRAQAAFVNATDNLTPADCWGDMGAASGPLLAALAVTSGLRNYAKGPRSLLWTSSENGQRSAALIHLQNRSF